MKNANEDQFNPYEPYLIVAHGTTSRKHRPLNRDVVTLGRASGCDIGLDARDVAELHCVVYRAPAGFRVRNCARRGTTRVNGEVVHEAQLKDGDVLQVSVFSFRVHLPTCYVAGTEDLALNDPRLLRLERSRRRLAERALKQRRLLRTRPEAVAPIPRKAKDADANEAGAVEPAPTTPLAEIFPEEARALRIRGRELDHYARYLQKHRRQPEGPAAIAPAESREEEANALLQAQLEQFEREKEFLHVEKTTTTTLLDQRRQELARDQTVLDEWKQQMEVIEREHHEKQALLDRRRAELDHRQAAFEEQSREFQRQSDMLRASEEKIQSRDHELKELASNLNALRRQLDGSKEEHSASEASLTWKREELQQSEAAQLAREKELENERAILAAEKAAWQRERADETVRLEARRDELARLETELRGTFEHLEPKQKEQATTALELARQADRIARADAALRQRRQELNQMMAEIRQAHQTLLNRRFARQPTAAPRATVEA